MTKEFKVKNGKIELSKEELKKLLDEAYWEGYRSGSNTTWTYTTPNWTPYNYTITTATTTAGTSGNIVKDPNILNGTITLTSTDTKLTSTDTKL